MAELKYSTSGVVARAPLLRGLAALDSDTASAAVQISAAEFEARLIQAAGEDFTQPQSGQRVVRSDASPEDGLVKRSVEEWITFVLEELRDVDSRDRFMP